MLNEYKKEIIEAEKTRMDLLKWKLIIVAILAAASLGIGYTNSSDCSNYSGFHRYAICLIPLVCAYVDLLCVHLQIRILVISKFFIDYPVKSLENVDSDIMIFKKYEEFCAAKRSIFNFQDWAQTTSTFILCFLVIGMAFFHFEEVGMWITISSGLFGILLSIIIILSYRRKYNLLNKEV